MCSRSINYYQQRQETCLQDFSSNSKAFALVLLEKACSHVYEVLLSVNKYKDNN